MAPPLTVAPLESIRRTAAALPDVQLVVLFGSLVRGRPSYSCRGGHEVAPGGALVVNQDLAAHWVADAGWDPPDDAEGAFDVLASRGAIPLELASQLRALVGLRNRIAHGYATVDHARLREEATSGVAAMRVFLTRVADAEGLPPDG